jgi:hypothetical protein
MTRDDKGPSSSAMILWTMILILVAAAAIAFGWVLIFHTPLARRIGATCLGLATALTLVRWIMQRFER